MMEITIIPVVSVGISLYLGSQGSLSEVPIADTRPTEECSIAGSQWQIRKAEMYGAEVHKPNYVRDVRKTTSLLV